MTTHHHFGRRGLAAALLGIVLPVAFVAGCGGEASAPASGASTKAATSSERSSIDVSLSEWAVKPSPTSAKAGDVKFEVSNKGAIPHELAVLKTDAAEGTLPQVNAAVDEKQGTLIGRTANIDAGKSETKSFTLQPGKYVLLCNIPAHYAQGMHVAFTVQ